MNCEIEDDVKKLKITIEEAKENSVKLQVLERKQKDERIIIFSILWDRNEAQLRKLEKNKYIKHSALILLNSRQIRYTTGTWCGLTNSKDTSESMKNFLTFSNYPISRTLCYRCQRFGHLAVDCPKMHKKHKKKSKICWSWHALSTM